LKKRWIISFCIITFLAITSLFWTPSNQLKDQFLPESDINVADVAWLLTSSSFVLLMTPGLSFFYGGMVGRKNVISTMLQSFICLGVVSLVWVVVGFSMAFGSSIGITIDDTYYGIIGNPFNFFQFNILFETIAVINPKKILSGIVINPAAGVMATNPTTAPMQAPNAETFLPLILSKNIQVIIADADAIVVVAKAIAAVPFAAKDEPALKPNHPNQSIPVPNKTKGIFVGICSLFLRFPKVKTPAKAAKPALICTTVPPAKSFMPK